jgi:putative ABC transport system ATP-binding protein
MSAQASWLESDGAEERRPVSEPVKRASLVTVQGLRKAYTRSGESLEILRGLDLEIPRGCFLALMGPSGSGKTTLLNILAGIDRPTSGSVRVADRDLTSLKDSELAAFRAENVGFIFQSFNLIPVLTAAENVELPLLLTRLNAKERRARARTALGLVGLQERADHLPRQLSGGQEQRVAIARALVTDPGLIVADEPTGDLDRQSADDVLKLLRRLASEFDKTIIMVTHDPLAAKAATVVRHMDKGVLE